MRRIVMALALFVSAGCATSGHLDGGDTAPVNNGNGGGSSGGGGGSSSSAGGGGSGATLFGDASIGAVPVTMIPVVVRDFRFYDPVDPTSDPDFEDPPLGINQGGQQANGYNGPWDDGDIVLDTLGEDGKPIYKNATGSTLTTHGKSSFDSWYRDVLGTNWHIDYSLPLVRDPSGALQYDSEVQGVPYGPGLPDQGRGFFPIDDHSAYASPFGNEGEPHNYSFTVEIHTVFTYGGGESFNFRGDDDVFVFINHKLVINLGGVHGPEQRQVSVDSLGLTKGQQYPLDFFSAERHVTGSNIEFETQLDLKPAPTQ